MIRRHSPSLLAACGALAVFLAAGCGPTAPSEEHKPAPAISVKLLQAPTDGLDGWGALEGKAVVLEFWATWCPSCVDDIPVMNALAERFKGKPVQFLSVTDEPEADVRAFLKEHPMAAWIGLDPKGKAFEDFGVRGRPTVVVIDQAGRVAGRTYPDLMTPEMIESILRGAGGSRP